MPAKTEHPAANSPLTSRAQALAREDFFRNPGRSQRYYFAELPAGPVSHRLVFDDAHQTAYCSCPFFPKPCGHALAFARLCGPGDFFPELAQMPDWASALLQGRSIRTGISADQAEQREAAVQQRRLERLERAEAGLTDLESWLLDTFRRGLATTASDENRYTDNIAARAADASLSGISRRLRLLSELPATDAAWSEKTLDTLAELWTAFRAFQQRAHLPEGLLHDLQNYLGISAKKEEALSGPDHVGDTWAVLGRREEIVENQLQVRRTWLLGANSGRYALLLDYAFGLSGGFPPGFMPGEVVKGTLAFYPSARPLRALATDDLHTLAKKVEKLPGYPDCAAFMQEWATAVGDMPWLNLMPGAFTALTPVRYQEQCWLRDNRGDGLLLSGLPGDGWKLLALGGGHPIGVFGEWDGTALRVLSVVADGRMVTL
ncbi:MAG: hypothetical protein IT259_04540 [Saprospiraceae bacterium]|nr:hypothetical protein [Saprospiraceae bacterium]